MANESRAWPRWLRGTAWLAGALLPVCPADAQKESLEGALGFLTGYDAVGVVERLDSLRPAPVSKAEKERVLATLPLDGDVATSMRRNGRSWPRRAAFSHSTNAKRSTS